MFTEIGKLGHEQVMTEENDSKDKKIVWKEVKTLKLKQNRKHTQWRRSILHHLFKILEHPV